MGSIKRRRAVRLDGGGLCASCHEPGATTVNILSSSLKTGRLAVLTFTLLAAALLGVRAAETSPGVALAIVYDTSGSMQQKVRDADGRMTPKNIIAARALSAVLDRLQAVASGPNASPDTVQVGLVCFQGDHAGQAIKCGPFSPKPFRDWLKRHNTPQRGTPLGDGVRIAGEMLLRSPLPRKHVLVITDGVNTQGPDPTLTMPRVQRQAKSAQANVSFHFVAFDVNAHVFAGVKNLGATVVAAADEKQLNSQLEFILEKRILLEDEEVPPAKPKTN
jgi:von Willebrand factor type A domain